MAVWNELHRDIIGEMMNIAAGQAAALLNEMTGEEIALSVPTVSFPTRTEVASILESELDERLAIVTQQLTGVLEGIAAMMIVDHDSKALVSIMIDPELPIDDVNELEAEAISELGNIVLNTTMGVLAESLDQEIIIGLPTFGRCDPETVIDQITDPVLPSIIVRMSLKSVPTGIGGILMFALDENSMGVLHDHIDRLASDVAA